MSIIQHHGRPRPFPVSYLERIYPMPRPFVSMDEWRRLHGDDLETFDDGTLDRERRCVQRRLDYEPDASRRAWLGRRIEAIDRERGSRHSQRRTVRPGDRRGPGLAGDVVTVAGQAVALPIPGGRHGPK